MNEFGHLAYHDENWDQPVYPEGHRYAGQSCATPYPNAAIPTKVAYLLARDGAGVSYNGVWTEPFGHDLTAWFFNEMYVGHSHVNDDFVDWADNFRETYHRLGEKCRGDPPPEACVPDKDEVDLSARALRAVGFWSQPTDISALGRPDGRVYPVDSAPVAVAYPGGGVDVFYVTAVPGPSGIPERHDLATVWLRDPLDTTNVPIPHNLTSPIPNPMLVFEPAAALHRGATMVAYVPGPTPGNIVLQEYIGGGLRDPRVFSFALTAQPVGMASFSGRLFFVYQDSATRQLRYFTDADSSSRPIVDPVSDDPVGAMPMLVADEGRGLYLFYRAATEEPPVGSGRFAMFVRRWNADGSGFGPSTRIQVAGSVCWLLPPRERVPVHTHRARGPTAALHHGRFQIFYPSLVSGVDAVDVGFVPVRHASLRAPEIGTTATVPVDSGTRETTVEATAGRRAWPVVVNSPTAGRILVVFWAGSLERQVGSSLLMA